jgi:hypothetical protein
MKNFDEAIKLCDIAIAKAREGSYDYVKLAKVIARKGSALEKSGHFDLALQAY